MRGIDTRIPVSPSARWRELPGVVRRLRAERYDAALDFQGLLKSAVLARLSGAGRVIGFSRHALRERTAAVFYREHRTIPRGQHVIAKNLRLAGALGVDVSQVAVSVRRAFRSDHRGALRGAEPRSGLAEQAVAAAAVRRDCRVAARSARDCVARALGTARAGPRARGGRGIRRGGASGAADPHRRRARARTRRAADGVRRHRVRCISRLPWGRQSSGSTDRRAPCGTAPGVPRMSRSRATRECECHHRRRCRRQGLGPCIEQITVAEVQAAIEQRLRA